MSDVLIVMTEEQEATQEFVVRLKVDQPGNLETMGVYRASLSDLRDWESVDYEVNDGFAEIQTSESGVFVARKSQNVAAIAGIAVAVVVVVAAVVIGVTCYMRANPEKRSRMFRHFQRKV